MKSKIPQDECSQLRATGHVPAQSWVIESVPVRIGRKRVGARKPLNLDIWPDISSEISDRGFQSFWTGAAAKHSYSTEWNKSSVRGTAAVGLEGRGAIDHDILVNIERSAQAARSEIIVSLAAE